MSKSYLRKARFLYSVCIAVLSVSTAMGKIVVYETDFDALVPGQTQYQPGDPNHDGWFLLGADTDGYGQIQSDIARGLYALEQFAAIEAGTGHQTINKRELVRPDLSVHPRVTLQADFFAHTSDPNARNTYTASLKVLGGPHPGYEILAFHLYSGNGNIKGDDGVSLSVYAFDGKDNHFVIPLSVGQHLQWDRWHSVELVIDQQQDGYVSITVDGQSQDISGYALHRSYYQGQWRRGQWIDCFHAEIVPTDNFGAQTDDVSYFDNISLTVGCPDEFLSDLNYDCLVNMFDLAMLASEWLAGQL